MERWTMLRGVTIIALVLCIATRRGADAGGALRFQHQLERFDGQDERNKGKMTECRGKHMDNSGTLDIEWEPKFLNPEEPVEIKFSFKLPFATSALKINATVLVEEDAPVFEWQGAYTCEEIKNNLPVDLKIPNFECPISKSYNFVYPVKNTLPLKGYDGDYKIIVEFLLRGKDPRQTYKGCVSSDIRIKE